MKLTGYGIFWPKINGIRDTQNPANGASFLLSIRNLDQYKIERNNQKLLELRSRSVKEQNKLPDTGGEKVEDQSEIQKVKLL